MADLGSLVEDTAIKAQYDENAKKILAKKVFLAQILVQCVEDFRNMEPKEVEKLIEGNPSVSKTPVEPGVTNLTLFSMSEQRMGGLG